MKKSDYFILPFMRKVKSVKILTRTIGEKMVSLPSVYRPKGIENFVDLLTSLLHGAESFLRS